MWPWNSDISKTRWNGHKRHKDRVKYWQGHGLSLKMRNDHILNSDYKHAYNPRPPPPPSKRALSKTALQVILMLHLNFKYIKTIQACSYCTVSSPFTVSQVKVWQYWRENEPKICKQAYSQLTCLFIRDWVQLYPAWI